jgi:OmpA-OmpF porin, OOP family
MSKISLRHLAVSIAAVSALGAATPALAFDGHAYVGVLAGPAGLDDPNVSIGTADDAGTFGASKGYEYGAFGGYDFGRFRLEAEVSQRDIDINNLDIRKGGIPLTSASIVSLGRFGSTGYARLDSAMLNALVDFSLNDRMNISVGAGVGQSRVAIRAANIELPWLNDKDTSSAWQVLASAQTPISQNLDVGLSFRVFKSEKLDVVDRLGRDVSTDMSGRSVALTLTYKFGGG